MAGHNYSDDIRQAVLYDFSAQISIPVVWIRLNKTCGETGHSMSNQTIQLIQQSLQRPNISLVMLWPQPKIGGNTSVTHKNLGKPKSRRRGTP